VTVRNRRRNWAILGIEGQATAEVRLVGDWGQAREAGIGAEKMNARAPLIDGDVGMHLGPHVGRHIVVKGNAGDLLRRQMSVDDRGTATRPPGRQRHPRRSRGRARREIIVHGNVATKREAACGGVDRGGGNAGDFTASTCSRERRRAGRTRLAQRRGMKRGSIVSARSPICADLPLRLHVSAVMLRLVLAHLRQGTSRDRGAPVRGMGRWSGDAVEMNRGKSCCWSSRGRRPPI